MTLYLNKLVEKFDHGVINIKLFLRCNNLVEVTFRYPTKVITYVTLIDSNNCTSHDLNILAFDQSLLQNKSDSVSLDSNSLSNSAGISSGNGTSQLNENFKLDKHISDMHSTAESSSDVETNEKTDRANSVVGQSTKDSSKTFSLSAIAANAGNFNN